MDKNRRWKGRPKVTGDLVLRTFDFLYWTLVMATPFFLSTNTSQKKVNHQTNHLHAIPCTTLHQCIGGAISAPLDLKKTTETVDVTETSTFDFTFRCPSKIKWLPTCLDSRKSVLRWMYLPSGRSTSCCCSNWAFQLHIWYKLLHFGLVVCWGRCGCNPGVFPCSVACTHKISLRREAGHETLKQST